jgi:hypothetical protein
MNSLCPEHHSRIEDVNMDDNGCFQHGVAVGHQCRMQFIYKKRLLINEELV